MKIATDDKKCKALVRTIDKAFEEYINLSVNNFPDALFSLEETEEPGRYCDIVSSYLILKPETKQELLETLEVIKRLEKLLFILKNEIEILKIEKKIGTKVKSRIDKVQKEYYLREQIKAIQEELGEDDENKKEIEEYESKINKAKLPKEAKEKAIYELNRLKSAGNYSAEGGVIRAYLDWILDLPWNKFTKDNIDINKAREVFEKEHYGLEDVKERIIEYLAVKKMSKTLKGTYTLFSRTTRSWKNIYSKVYC